MHIDNLRTGILKQKQRFIAVGLLALLLITAVYSLLAGLADIYNHQFDRYEHRWQKQGSVTSLEEWQVANLWMDRALKLDADHPDYLLSKGRLASWRFYIEADESSIEDKRQSAKEGLGFIKSSLAVRPGWPYAWVALVRLKAQMGEADPDFFHAWDRAQNLGPWEPDVQLTLLDVGLGLWPELTFERRLETIERFRALVGLPAVARQSFSVAKNHSMDASLCAALNFESYPKWVAVRCKVKAKI